MEKRHKAPPWFHHLRVDIQINPALKIEKCLKPVTNGAIFGIDFEQQINNMRRKRKNHIFSSKNQSKLINNQIFSFILYLFVSSLILLQPDFSMFVIISFIYFGQLFISGLKWRWVIFCSLFFSFVSFIAYFLLDNIKIRIDNFLYPSTGDNYQITKSLQAIKEGGLFGKGPGMGTVKDNLPDAHTDFIFSVIAEEFGLISCLFIIIF